MDDRSSQIMGVCILFFALSWITVLLRIYVRTCLIKSFGLDDTAMLLTLVLFTIYCACQLGGAVHGTGRHRSELTDQNAQIALRYWFFCEIFYTLSTSVLKISIGFFLLRIAINPIQVWIIRILMVCSAVLGVTYCCVVIFQCNPVSFWWDLNPNHTGKCLSASLVTDLTYVVSALNSTADWTFGSLPIFIVKDLKMKRSAKVIVSVIIALAAVGSTATIIRLPYTWTLKVYKGDFLWRTSDFAMWTTVEVGVGITAGCLATLKPLLKQFLSIVGIQSTANLGSTIPWSGKRTNPGKLGYSIHDQSFARAAASKSLTTTTVTGRGLSSGDNEEDTFHIRGQEDTNILELTAWKGGISKRVHVSTTEERDSTNSESSLREGDDERHVSDKPAMVYERL